MAIKLTKSLSSITSQFDAFIINQWGVLHNGQVLYTATLVTMQDLRDHGVKTITLSNSSKRRASSVQSLSKVGLDPALHAGHGSTFFIKRDADFVLAGGIFVMNRETFEGANDLIANINTSLCKCAESKLPMIVSNPDFYRPGPIKSPMPGLVALEYAQLLGDALPDEYIKYIGKLHDMVHESCFASLDALGCRDNTRSQALEIVSIMTVGAPM